MEEDAYFSVMKDEDFYLSVEKADDPYLSAIKDDDPSLSIMKDDDSYFQPISDYEYLHANESQVVPYEKSPGAAVDVYQVKHN